MLKTHTLTLGLYQTNCYIVHNESSKTCIVIDPGYAADTILNRAALLGLEIEAILLTHGHFDHVGAVRQIAADTDCKVYLHEKELSLPAAMTDGPLYYTDLYGAEGTLSVAGLDIKVIHTPGHTPGSVCLMVGDTIFSGDTLFAGSMGRCDFPGSNIFDMRKSLRKLRDLPGDYRVLPGHAEDTTLDYERKTNPYLR
jgi:glyoxylase-like metal-dependent hydrolase (beta-lactamase superfamily II)